MIEGTKSPKKKLKRAESGFSFCVEAETDISEGILEQGSSSPSPEPTYCHD